MKKIIIITGKSASGKDTLLKELILEQPEKLHKIVSTTTRPKRSNEVDGVDYYFVSPSEMLENIFLDKVLEAENFNDWVYGTYRDTVSDEKINITVLTPNKVEVWKSIGYETVSVEVIVDDKTRLLRSLNRDENVDVKEVVRRFSADEKMFEDNDEVDFKGSYEECKNYILENL